MVSMRHFEFSFTIQKDFPGTVSKAKPGYQQGGIGIQHDPCPLRKLVGNCFSHYRLQGFVHDLLSEKQETDQHDTCSGSKPEPGIDPEIAGGCVSAWDRHFIRILSGHNGLEIPHGFVLVR